MGDTLPPSRRGHALEGVSRHGRAAPVCGPPARGREDGAAVRRVRDLPKDRLQDLRPDKDGGVVAFSDRSRRPYRQANRLPPPIEATIVRLKREYPGWGAPKIREKLRQQIAPVQLPATSTVHAVLDRHQLVKRRRRRRGGEPSVTALTQPTTPNALWCADYKGEFMLGNRRYCYPLTITDFASRYLLTCEALA